MPICLSQNRRFRGIYSQREFVWEAIKKLEGQDDAVVSDQFLILAQNGRVKIGDRVFCRFSYATLCRELRAQTRIAIYDSNGENFMYAIWLTAINQIYYTPAEIERINAGKSIYEENPSEPESGDGESCSQTTGDVVAEDNEFTPEELQKIKDGQPVFARDVEKDVYGESTIPKEAL